MISRGKPIIIKPLLTFSCLCTTSKFVLLFQVPLLEICNHDHEILWMTIGHTYLIFLSALEIYIIFISPKTASFEFKFNLES